MNTEPTVVIIGRINVGKSALFNRLSDTSRALVSSIPGTTRDYNIATVNWGRKKFQLIDTGGVDSQLVKNSIESLLSKKDIVKNLSDNPIEAEIIAQTKRALEKSNLILMVVDTRSGIMPQDKQLALALKKFGRPILLVANKADNIRQRSAVTEFHKLGLGEPIPVSAASGSGSGDLLDIVIKNIKGKRGRPAKEKTDQDLIKVAFIGKPNAGKSSLINQLVGEARVIVSPVAQTTREPQDIEIEYLGHRIQLIDTAGLRKKARIEVGLEKKSTAKSYAVLKKADVILFITQAQERLTKQDSYLGGLIKDSKSGVIIVGNKWDLIAGKDEKSDKKMTDYYRANLQYLHFAPIIFTSALTGKNVQKILDLIVAVDQQRRQEINQAELEEVMKKLIKHHRPAQAKGLNRPRVYSIKQSRSNPPHFEIEVGRDQTIHFSYIRFIENQIRHHFDFAGVPITIHIISRKEK